MVDSINTKINPVVVTETEPQKPVAVPQFRSNDNNTLERNPEEDSFEKKDSSSKKLGIGALVVAGLAVAGYFIFRGKKDAVEQPAKEIAKDVKNEAEKIYEKIDKQLHQKTEFSPEILDRNLAPKEKAGAWTKDDMAQYYAELEVKAQEGLKESFEQAIGVKSKHPFDGPELRAATEKQIIRTKEILNPELLQEKLPELMKEAEKIVEIIDSRFAKKVDNYVAITKKGFKALSETPEKMENGSYRIIKTAANGNKLEFISEDGNTIHRIKMYSGDKLLEQVSYYDKGKLGTLGIYDESGVLKEHIDFDAAKSDIFNYMNFLTKQQVCSKGNGFYRSGSGLKIENISKTPVVIREC